MYNNYGNYPANDLQLELLKVFTIINIWIGEDPAKKYNKGNSLLLQIKQNEYIWIGWKIVKFKLNQNEKIEDYVSPIGNSDVPYPYIVTNKNVYLMLEDVYVDKKLLGTDYYSSYYDNKPVSKPIKGLKTLIDRF